MKNGLALAGCGDAESTSSRRHRRKRLVLVEMKGPCRRTSADFARQATIAEFGWTHARALDQADFRDRPPGQFPVPVSEESPL